MTARLRMCAWCAAAVAAEVALYLSYRGHDARFHWFTHFFVGASAALVVMAVVTTRTRRPAPRPLVFVLAGHLIASLPDILFIAGFAHQRWMDIFLGHLSSHYMPGRNVSWYVVLLAALAMYLIAVDRLRSRESEAEMP